MTSACAKDVQDHSSDVLGTYLLGWNEDANLLYSLSEFVGVHISTVIHVEVFETLLEQLSL